MTDQPAKHKRRRLRTGFELLLAVALVISSITNYHLFGIYQQLSKANADGRVEREVIFAAGKRAYDDGKRAADDLKACKRRINPRDL